MTGCSPIQDKKNITNTGIQDAHKEKKTSLLTSGPISWDKGIVTCTNQGDLLITRYGVPAVRVQPPAFEDANVENSIDYTRIPFFDSDGKSTWPLEKMEHRRSFIKQEEEIMRLDLKKSSGLKTASPFYNIQDISINSYKLWFRYWIDPLQDKQASANYLVSVNYYDDHQKLITSEVSRVFPNEKFYQWNTVEVMFQPQKGACYVSFGIVNTGTLRGTWYMKDFRVYRNQPIASKLQNYSYKRIQQDGLDGFGQSFQYKDREVRRNVLVDTTNAIIHVSQTTSYKKEVQVLKEYEPVWVTSDECQYIGRDDKLHTVAEDTPSFIGTIDASTPYFAKFQAGSSISCMNGYSSVETVKSKGTYFVRIYGSHDQDIKQFLINQDGTYHWTYSQKRVKGMQVSLQYNIFLLNRENIVIPSRTPHGTKATFILTNHPDSNTVKTLKAVMMGTSNEKDPLYGKAGLIPRNLTATWGFFNQSYKRVAGMDDPAYRTLLEFMKNHQIEIVPHTLSPVASENTRQLLMSALPGLAPYGIRNWIDHSVESGVRSAAIKSEGSIPQSIHYSLDLLMDSGIEYCWSYLDLHLKDLNMLSPDNSTNHPQIFFKNDNIGDKGRELYQWNTYRPFDFIKETNTIAIDKLVSERGISIIHDYFTHKNQFGKFYTQKGNDVYLTPQFDDRLALLADYQARNLLWIPTVTEFIDYSRSLAALKYDFKTSQQLVITNPGDRLIQGFTLILLDSHMHEKQLVMDIKPGINRVHLD